MNIEDLISKKRYGEIFSFKFFHCHTDKLKFAKNIAIKSNNQYEINVSSIIIVGVGNRMPNGCFWVVGSG